ncbi:MAG TPA: Clp1/GlmU family protein [Armatimonadota bacterium]|nr:Clp1/GlmU family protein [Armatimonadota bacterium]
MDSTAENSSAGTAAAPDPIVERLAALTGVILFCGASDTGKTTLIQRVASAALAQRRAVAIIDADVGQSNIGPPGAIGMSLFREAPDQFRVRRPDALSFVGSTQPFGFFLEMVSGVCQLTHKALDAGADLALVDTTGVAPTLGGLRLKEAKLRHLRPNHLALIERRRELHPLAQFAQACEFCEVHRIPAPPGAHVKPAALRRAHRQQVFGDYFQGARVQRLSLRGLGISGTSLFSGRTLSPAALLRVSEMLRAPALRAELTGDRLTVITARAPSKDGIAILQQRFSRLQIRAHLPNITQGLLAGLEDGAGNLLDLCILQSCDFTNLIVTLASPFTDLGAVRVLRIGALRLRPDGVEISSLRPGDL